ncbi:ABC transporter permease [Schumannella luteola]|uniref:Peptide/nickel transport system permease protein n=1 Tax=Schumannella luteola TaxID=472059 RepID=A0A852YB39_9MICO|nr:ABC transporter permease [Schumannella luteola]NYG98570.1 peptide/nickel transport system permease protein [Schumannella luteola]TPX02551.1 ABC transporter permease [Schumannella luteola]
MKFLIRRVIFYVITAWAAVTLNFFIPRLLPGDPVQSLINKYQGRLSTDAIQSLYVLFGLDEKSSLWDDYVKYWAGLFKGDFGISFTYFPTPVSEVISQSLPWTLLLVGISTILGFILGTLAGVGLGWRRGTWADGLLPVANFFSAIPYFWLGLIAISLFAVIIPIFPASGGYEGGLIPDFSADFIGSAIYHGILPALTIVISSIAGWILSMRNMMVTVSSEDYVTVAQAKGLSERKVMFGYAARNAVLPSISGFALSLGFIVGGTLVTEMVFSYPGIGFTLFQAISSKDYPLMQGIFLIITLSVLVANMVADFAYAVLDPRTRQEG